MMILKIILAFLFPVLDIDQSIDYVGSINKSSPTTYTASKTYALKTYDYVDSDESMVSLSNIKHIQKKRQTTPKAKTKSYYKAKNNFSYKIQNTNFTVSQDYTDLKTKDSYIYNYNRFRLQADYKKNQFFFRAVGDIISYASDEYISSNDFQSIKLNRADTPLTLQSKYSDVDTLSTYFLLHRLYGGWSNSKHKIIVGLQDISIGLGNIYSPVNLFNHKKPYALELYETYPVLGISYTRYMKNRSKATIIATQKADKTFKYVGQYKVVLKKTHMGIDFITSDNVKMLGYEIKKNLARTKLNLKNETAYIKDDSLSINNEFVQTMIGADYRFSNGAIIKTEALYSSKKFSTQEMLANKSAETFSSLTNSDLYTSVSFSYNLNSHLKSSLLYTQSFNDANSKIFVPYLKYTLNKHNSFILSSVIHSGDENSEFKKSNNIHYLKWVMSFR